MARLPTFEDKSVHFTDKVILLDVDGTLAPDRSLQFETPTLDKIKLLAATNLVYLCTNTRSTERREMLKKVLGLPVTDSRYKKPSAKVLTALDIQKRDVVVIGDKFVTDYLLAKNIGAAFVKVQRKESGQERYFIKLLNRFDDFLSFLFIGS